MLKAFVQLSGTPLTSTTEDSDSDDDQDDEIECTTDLADMDYLPPHIPCFLHSLQLVVKDGLNNMGTGSAAIAKGAKLVSHVRHSCLASDLLEDGYKLQAKNDTRWNSTLVMLKSLLKADPLKLEKLNTQYKLSTFDMKICKEIINILTPFKIATTQCQSQNSVTASLVIPCIRGLKAELDEFSTTSKSKLISTLITSINKRLHKYESNDAFKLAAVLDPRRKLDWCSADEVEDIKSLIKLPAWGPSMMQRLIEQIHLQLLKKSSCFALWEKAHLSPTRNLK